MMIYYESGELIIRSMIEDDIDKILAAFRAQGWSKDAAYLAKLTNEQRQGKRYVFIAEVKGEICGYVNLIPRAQSGPFKRKYPELSDFIVFEKYQNRSIGSKLLDCAEEKARDLGEYVTLGVGLHSGYGTAQRMYIKRGYIPDGKGVYYEGRAIAQYTQCVNDDELNIYMMKKLK